MRELERNGGAVATAAEPEQTLSPVIEPQQEAISADYQAPVLTRRQLREQSGRAQEHTLPAVQEPDPIVVIDEPELVAVPEEVSEPETVSNLPSLEDGRVTPRPAPLPPIGLRRDQRQPAHDIEHEEPANISSLDAEIPEEGFRGANYLGEPSTQSIMLEVAPEAISLALDTGEVFSTGSISILSDATGSITGSLDGIDLDRDEAVTGVISVVDPVSARDYIDERSPLGVVPSRVLLKGWWRPWAVGAFSLAMAIAAILASITIFNALGA